MLIMIEGVVGGGRDLISYPWGRRELGQKEAGKWAKDWMGKPSSTSQQNWGWVLLSFWISCELSKCLQAS